MEDIVCLSAAYVLYLLFRVVVYRSGMVFTAVEDAVLCEAAALVSPACIQVPFLAIYVFGFIIL